MLSYNALNLTQTIIDELTLEDTKLNSYRAIITEFTELALEAKGIMPSANLTLMNNLITKINALDDMTAFNTALDALSLTQTIIDDLTLEDAKIADYRSIATSFAGLSSEAKVLLDSADVTLMDNLTTKINALDDITAFNTALDALSLTQTIIDNLTLEDAKIADYRSIATSFAGLSSEAKALLDSADVTLMDNLTTKLTALDSPVI
jgi:hypothetical protein